MDVWRLRDTRRALFLGLAAHGALLPVEPKMDIQLLIDDVRCQRVGQPPRQINDLD